MRTVLTSVRNNHRIEVALATLLAMVLAIHVWSLLRFPAPFVDEAWFAARAWAFLQTGRAFGSLDRGVFDQFDGSWTFFQWLPVVLQSTPLRLVSAPALLPIRLVSLFFGLVILATIYSIGSVLYGRRVGLLAALLLAVSRFFFYSAHLARYDIMTAAFGFLAVALYLHNRSERLWMGVASGVCVSLAFETHTNGVVFGLAIVALYFSHFRWSMFHKNHFWGYILGAGLGLGLYVLLHVARHPESYVAFNRVVFGVTHTPPILTLDPQVLLQSLSDMTIVLLALYNILIVFVAWAVAFLIRRRSETDKLLLVLSGVLVAGFILLVRNKLAYYLVLLTPAFDLMVGVLLFEESCQVWQGRLWDYARWIIIVGIGVGGLLMNQSEIVANRYETYEQAQVFVGKAVAPDDSIMGPQTYWFGLYDHDYYSWEGLIYYQRLFNGSTLCDALIAFHPDILIIDGQMSGFISDTPGKSLYAQHLRLPKDELYGFLQDTASLIAIREIDFYGPIRIYRIEWREDQSRSLAEAIQLQNTQGRGVIDSQQQANGVCPIQSHCTRTTRIE